MGKKLAKISKEAKERKREQREREKNESEQEQINRITDLSGYVDFRYVFGGITIINALGGLYYAYKNDKIQTKLFEQNKALKQNDHVSELSEREVLKQSDCGSASKAHPSTKLSCIENL